MPGVYAGTNTPGHYLRFRFGGLFRHRFGQDAVGMIVEIRFCPAE